MEQEEEKAPGKEGNESIKCDRILEKKQTSDRTMSYLMENQEKIKDWVRETNENEKKWATSL